MPAWILLFAGEGRKPQQAAGATPTCLQRLRSHKSISHCCCMSRQMKHLESFRFVLFHKARPTPRDYRQPTSPALGSGPGPLPGARSRGGARSAGGAGRGGAKGGERGEDFRAVCEAHQGFFSVVQGFGWTGMGVLESPAHLFKVNSLKTSVREMYNEPGPLMHGMMLEEASEPYTCSTGLRIRVVLVGGPHSTGFQQNPVCFSENGQIAFSGLSVSFGRSRSSTNLSVPGSQSP